MYEGLKNLEVPRKPPRGRRYARRGLASVAVLALIVGALGVCVYQRVNSRLDDAQQELIVDPEVVGQPINVLVLGSDARDALSREERKKHPELRGPAGKRSDTIILIHISRQAKKAVALSFPRDLRVRIPGHGTSRLNAAYSIGGPQLVIDTIKSLTDIPIHHYVEINFASFREIVDAVGGVEVCVNRAYDDKKSGLKVARPGCYTFDGKMSLAYVRARYIEDGSDLSRIERQQKFMRSLMDKVKSVRFLFDVPKVLKLADAIAEGVVLSQDVDLTTARGIANRLAGDQKNMDYRIVPNIPRYIGGASYVLARQPQADRLFAAIRDDRKLPNTGKTGASLPRHKDVTVTVLNGAGANGLAATEAEKLRKLGFTVRRVDTYSRIIERTQIRFEHGGELKARLVEVEYPFAEITRRTRAQATDIVIILGKDAARPPPSPSD